jgi:hypothetical protein
MNPFVNPNKRSVLLPAGCKDLIDVLKPSKRRSVAELITPSSVQIPTIEPVRYEKAGLIHVREHLAEFIASRSLQASLHIRSLDGLLGVSLCRFEVEFSIFPLPNSGERTERIERFFTKRGISANYDQTIGQTGIPGGALRILGFPLPVDFSTAAELTSNLLREVYHIDDETGLEFTWVNVKLA